MNDSRHFLEMLVKMMGPEGVPAFILANGREFQPDAQTFKGHRRTPKQCFMNATKMAIANAELTYVEGYVTALIPIHHAWLMKPDGSILDPTIKVKGRSEASAPRDYFGVPFSTEYLIRAAIINQVYGLLSYCSRKTLGPLMKGEELNWRTL